MIPSPFYYCWALLASSVLSNQTRSLFGLGPRGPANTGPQWLDYPAYALSLPPQGSVLGSNEFGSTSGKKGKKKNAQVPVSQVPGPLFDIMVEPEYIPDPFPVPYPFPVEQQYPHQQPPLPAPQAPRPALPPSSPQIYPQVTRVAPKYKRHQYIERAEADWVCPRDYIEEAGNCVKIDQVDVEVGCPEGWKYKNGMCHSVSTMAPDAVCDEGFVPWENKGECYREIEAPKEMLCPPGFLGTLHGCKKMMETPATLQCVDAVLKDGRCVRDVSARPIVSCPHDFVKIEHGNMCWRESLVEAELVCPSHNQALKAGGICEAVALREPSLVCDPDFILYENSICKQEIVQPAHLMCEDGLMQQDGVCIFTEPGPAPHMTCEVGILNLQTSLCEERQEIPAERTCPKGYMLDPHQPFCVSKGVSKEKKKSIITVAPQVSCPRGFTVTQSQMHCQSFRTVDPLGVCPPPYYHHDSQCLKSVTLPATSICPAGMTIRPDGSCYQKLMKPAMFACQDGFFLDEHNHCAFVEQSAALIQCPSGYEAGAEGARCRRIEKMQPDFHCPPNTQLMMDPSTHDMVCHTQIVTEPQVLCTVPGMKLEETPNGEFICVGKKVEAAKFQCPAPYREDGDRCIKYEVAPKRALCPESYTFSFNICLKEVDQPPVLLCPEGFAHHQPSESCVRKRLTDLSPVCPNDMQFDKLVGECYVMKVDYEFDESAPLNGPEENLKDLQSPIPTTTTTIPPPLTAGIPPPLTSPLALPREPVALPAPQLTVIQQPVVIPQPAVILPQQAPVPPPPAIRVPYAVPQPVPTPMQPQMYKHVHHQTTGYIQPPAPPAQYVNVKTKKK